MNIRKSFTLVLSLFLAVGAVSCGEKESKSEVKTYTSFFEVIRTGISENNTIQNLIAEKTGAKCIETWLSESNTAADIVDKMIIADEYPDYLYTSTQYNKLRDANAYIPIDEYWDGCENLKKYFTEEQWDKIRDDDGHIYIIPCFSSVYMYDTNTVHDDEAFWIQVKVLKWAGYPKITTLDEYFDVIERYLEANPTAEDGTPNIGYEILTEGFRYFCLENPPQFLAGYPNDGCCIVDPDTLEVIDLNITDTAKRWFKKLNEEYKKGVIDQDCFLLTAQQYFDKLATGNVLGMVDQHWNFKDSVLNLPDECTYVPLGVVLDEGTEEHYHSEVALNTTEGLGISSSCKDIKGAVKFINDLLDPEIHTLRFWGREGVDYSVDDESRFYFTDEQRALCKDADYAYSNKCEYEYFPYYKGMNQDGINACEPLYQPYEYYQTLSDIMQECFAAYGVQTYVELLNKSGKNKPWYPMWSYLNTFTNETDYGRARASMDTVKHEYLPKVVMSKDFDSGWDEYMSVYKSQCDTAAYLRELQAYVKRCVE